MFSQDDKVLGELKHSLHVSCREGWYDNLTKTIFHLSHDTTNQEDEAKIDEEYDQNLAQLDKDIEEKTQESIRTGELTLEVVKLETSCMSYEMYENLCSFVLLLFC